MSLKITADSYTFVERPSSLLYAVKILEGEYKGVIVTYGKVSIQEQSGLLRLSFQYKIEEAKEHDSKKLESSNEFRNLLGDVLSHILDTSLSNNLAKIGSNADPRTLQAKHVTEPSNDDSPETHS